MDERPRRGWRERIEAGVYRSHRVACASSHDLKPGRRCGCPLQIQVPGERPASTRFQTMEATLTEARAERRRLLAAGRPKPIPPGRSPITLREFAAEWFRRGANVWAPATIEARDLAYRTRIDPAFGARPLGDPSRDDVQSWALGLDDQLDRFAAAHESESPIADAQTMRETMRGGDRSRERPAKDRLSG